MDGVLHKPFTIQALADCLMRLAPHQAQPGQAGTPNIVSLGERDEPSERAEEAILDPEILGQLDDMAANGRADFVNRVCGLYLDHAPKTHEDIKRALGDRDTEALGRAAHALKSMSYNIGAIRLARLAGDIERAARIDNTIIGGPQYDSFATVLAVTLDAVKSRLGENKQPARLPAAGRA
jgi:HPt (histidine-containing phosphotransfer) domain-containing protein